MKLSVTIAALLTVLLTTAGVCRAGDVNPPAAPGPTMKTLDQVRPGTPIPGSETAAGKYTISRPGQYYLTGNRMISYYGIEITADNVTLDLNGFELYADADGATYGIQMTARRNVTIQNGSVRGFSTGINENHTTSGYGHRLIDVRVLDCIGMGVQLLGKCHQVIRCTILNNGNRGLNIPAANSLIKECTVVGNGFYGIYAYEAGINVIGNVVSDNDTTGIAVSSGCVVQDNTCCNNNGYGIYAFYGSLIKNNACYSNQNDGIKAYAATVIGNNAYNNQNYGINAGNYSMVDQNSAHNNNQSGGDYTNIYYNSTFNTYGTNYPGM